MSSDTKAQPDALVALDAIPQDRIPAAIARLAARAMEPPPAASDPADELLTPDEVASILKADRRFVYRHARALGGVRLSRRKLRFTMKRLQRYLDTRR